MAWRRAFIRAIRSFLQACAAALLAFLVVVGKDSTFDWANLKVEGSKLAFALILAFGYALVSFIHNALEDNFGAGEATFKG